MGSVDILGAGSFTNRRGNRCVLYLDCASELLEAFRYKPDFPDSIFHITLYEGPTTSFSTALLDALYGFPWHLRVHFAQPVPFDEIEVGTSSGGRHKRRARFSIGTEQLVASIVPRLRGVNLATLGDQDRLAAITGVLQHLHDHSSRTSVPAPAHVRVLQSPALVIDRPSLWVSSPVPSEDSQHRLTSSEARGGSLVLTPPELAEEIVAYSLQVHDQPRIDYGEPAFGSGIFFAVLANLLGSASARLTSATAIEINRERAAVAAERWQHRDLQMIVGDFLTAEPTTQWNFVVANPPYVRSQDIPDVLKMYVRGRLEHELGLDVSARSNLYVYFLLTCHRWLRVGATASWLLPADFMTTRYGQVLCQYLTRHVTPVRVHTYNPTEARFENVRIASAVVVYKNEPAPKHANVELSRGGSLLRPDDSRHVTVSALRDVANWQLVTQGRPLIRNRGDVRIGDLFRIRRGIATGGNEYFVLDEARASSLGVEIAALRPVLPRPRYMPEDGIVYATEAGLPAITPHLFIIDTSESIGQIASRAPGLARYLENAPEAILQRHLVRRRRIFYKQEHHEGSLLVASAMGRFDGPRGPVTYYVNEARAAVLNNYLCLYPLADVTLTTIEGQQILECLRTVDPQQYRMCGREYAGGMYKLEPRELSSVGLARNAADEIRDVLQAAETSALRLG